MKNLKVVFASLLIAALGIVGFSSFSTTNKSTLLTKTYTLNAGGDYFDPSDWTEAPPQGCSGSDEYCSVTVTLFDSEDEFTIDDFASSLPNLATTNPSSPMTLGGHSIEFDERAPTPGK